MIAKALSARALLRKLDGAEREDLLRAMKANDLETIRAIMARHREGAALRVEVEGHRDTLEPPPPTCRVRGWMGGSKAKRKGPVDPPTGDSAA